VDFRGIRLDELLRIPIPRTSVNKGLLQRIAMTLTCMHATVTPLAVAPR
jgi:hypothetical protein